MAVKIRMRRQGRRNQPFYRIVVADSRTRRDGRYIEALGWYNPAGKDEDNNFSIDVPRIEHWLDEGAILSENMEVLVKRAAPSVIKAHHEKELAHRAKLKEKKKAGKKA